MSLLCGCGHLEFSKSRTQLDLLRTPHMSLLCVCVVTLSFLNLVHIGPVADPLHALV